MCACVTALLIGAAGPAVTAQTACDLYLWSLRVQCDSVPTPESPVRAGS